MLPLELTVASEQQLSGIRTALGIQPQYKTICCVGSSISDGAVVATNVLGTFTSGLNAKHPAWIPTLLDNKVKLVGRSSGKPDYGIAGAGVAQLLNDTLGNEGGFYPFSSWAHDACEKNADVYVLESGANDFDTNAHGIMARLEAFWTFFTSRGKRVIAINLLPTDSYQIAARGAIIKAVNYGTNAGGETLAQVAIRLGVTLIDICQPITGSDGSQVVTAEWISDDGLGVHPSHKYAIQIAAAIADVIRPYTVYNEQVVRLPDKDDYANWVTVNPRPSQNTIPTGWTCETATWAAVTDANGKSWQRITRVGTGASLYVNWLAKEVGARVRAVCRMKVVSGDITNLYHGAACYAGPVYGSLGVYTMYSFGVGASVLPLTDKEFLFISDVLTIPSIVGTPGGSAAGNVTASLNIWCATGFVMEITDFGMIYDKPVASFKGPGTVQTFGNTTVTGTGTTFLADFRVGDKIIIAAVAYYITAIASNLSLTVSANATAGNTQQYVIAKRAFVKDAFIGDMCGHMTENPIFDYQTLPHYNLSHLGPRTNDHASGATITAFQCCYLASTGKWLLASGASDAASNGLLSVSLESKADTQLMAVALSGSIIRNDTWTWTIGGRLYLDPATPGSLTQTPPTSGQYKRIVGYALTADSIMFDTDRQNSLVP